MAAELTEAASLILEWQQSARFFLPPPPGNASRSNSNMSYSSVSATGAACSDADKQKVEQKHLVLPRRDVNVNLRQMSFPCFAPPSPRGERAGPAPPPGAGFEGAESISRAGGSPDCLSSTPRTPDMSRTSR